nr:immunoglobulin heavy chain junction region [Mus musculus]
CARTYGRDFYAMDYW